MVFLIPLLNYQASFVNICHDSIAMLYLEKSGSQFIKVASFQIVKLEMLIWYHIQSSKQTFEFILTNKLFKINNARCR